MGGEWGVDSARRGERRGKEGPWRSHLSPSPFCCVGLGLPAFLCDQRRAGLEGESGPSRIYCFISARLLSCNFENLKKESILFLEIPTVFILVILSNSISNEFEGTVKSLDCAAIWHQMLHLGENSGSLLSLGMAEFCCFIFTYST